ncbi:hypothetical protein PR202_ga27840 [Eleusine coracana subsp. coracana]|uniref:Uncharacterized protein n=1 Tax=Eleusine coracana subsp. coracana TaxID=191504 RepID=A0AAV5DH69_ELECO|nr:hypothetical protein PR202_ga27840 [Eleusine coracana subsp. coracana]
MSVMPARTRRAVMTTTSTRKQRSWWMELAGWWSIIGAWWLRRAGRDTAAECGLGSGRSAMANGDVEAIWWWKGTI